MQLRRFRLIQKCLLFAKHIDELELCSLDLVSIEAGNLYPKSHDVVHRFKFDTASCPTWCNRFLYEALIDLVKCPKIIRVVACDPRLDQAWSVTREGSTDQK